MSESKQYRISNNEPGPRGVETAAHGLVMVQPTQPGTTSGIVATLTDEEAKNAKRQGLTLDDAPNSSGIEGTENRPAEGHIDPNHPDAAELLASSRKKAAAAAGAPVPQAGGKPKGGNGKPEGKPAGSTDGKPEGDGKPGDGKPVTGGSTDGKPEEK